MLFKHEIIKDEEVAREFRAAEAEGQSLVLASTPGSLQVIFWTLVGTALTGAHTNTHNHNKQVFKDETVQPQVGTTLKTTDLTSSSAFSSPTSPLCAILQ